MPSSAHRSWNRCHAVHLIVCASVVTHGVALLETQTDPAYGARLPPSAAPRQDGMDRMIMDSTAAARPLCHGGGRGGPEMCLAQFKVVPLLARPASYARQL